MPNCVFLENCMIILTCFILDKNGSGRKLKINFFHMTLIYFHLLLSLLLYFFSWILLLSLLCEASPLHSSITCNRWFYFFMLSFSFLSLIILHCFLSIQLAQIVLCMFSNSMSTLVLASTSMILSDNISNLFSVAFSFILIARLLSLINDHTFFCSIFKSLLYSSSNDLIMYLWSIIVLLLEIIVPLL